MYGADMSLAAAGRPGIFSTFQEPRMGSMLGSAFGIENPIANLGVAMGSQWLFSQMGYLPGQFMPTQNIYDQFRARDYQIAQMTAVQQGFESDRGAMVQMMRGVAQMTGVTFGMDQLRAANTMAGGMASVLPYIAPMAPTLFDSMFGSEGSKGIAASITMRRGLHEVDPVTGLMGLSATTASQRVEQMFNDIYRSGTPGEGVAQMRGLGIGAAADMAAELQRRGMGGASIGAMGRADQDRSVQSVRESLGRMDMPTDEARRTFDSQQVTSSVKKMAASVAAIRDLFGENGQPDAPMQQLFQALSNLTSGGLAMRQPEELERTVRQTQSLLRMGGISLDAYSSLLARGGHVAQQMGLDPSLAPGFTLPAVSSGIAYGQVQGMASPAYGRLDREQYMLAQQQLGARAMASGPANELAALVRYQDATGGLRGDALELVEAIKRGDSVDRVSPARLQQMFRENAGADSQIYLGATDANRAIMQKYRIDRVVFNQQGQEAQMLAHSAFMRSLGAHGIDPDRADSIGRKMSQALFDMDLDTVGDDSRRTSGLARTLRGMLGNRDDLNAIVEGAYGQFGNETQRRAGQSAQATLQLFNRGARERAAEIDREAATSGRMASAMAGLNRVGPMGRLADIIKNPSGGSLTENLAKFLGGISPDEINNSMAAALSGGPDVAANIGGSDDRTRMSLVAQAIRSTHETYDRLRSAGASNDQLTPLVGDMEALVSGGQRAGTAYNALKSQVMSRYGLNEAQFNEVLSGNSQLVKDGIISADVRDRLIGLAGVSRGGKGVIGLAEGAGVITGAKVGGEDLSNIALKGVQYADMQASLRSDPSNNNKDFKDRAVRVGHAAIDQARRVAGVALADESNKTIEAFGPGSWQKFRNIDDNTREIDAIAGALGMSREAILASDETTGAIAEAKIEIAGRIDQITKTSNQLANDYNKKKGPMSPDEMDDLKAWRKNQTDDPHQRNERILDKILKETGGSLDAEDRESVLKQMGDIKDSDHMSAALESALKHYKTAEGSGKPTDLDKKVMGKLWDVGGAGDPRHLSGQAGDSTSTRAGIEDLLRREKERETKPQTMTVKLDPTSTVRIDRDQITFNNVSGLGSTPPVGIV